MSAQTTVEQSAFVRNFIGYFLKLKLKLTMCCKSSYSNCHKLLILNRQLTLSGNSHEIFSGKIVDMGVFLIAEINKILKESLDLQNNNANQLIR